jgi:hypothetical protein
MEPQARNKGPSEPMRAKLVEQLSDVHHRGAGRRDGSCGAGTSTRRAT